MKRIDLKDIGLCERFINEAVLYKDLYTGRVSSQHKDLYTVITEEGEILAKVSGKLRNSAKNLYEFPATGDFVMLDRINNDEGNAIIHHILTRKSAFERKTSGTANETQVVASNIDTVFICMSLNNDFNLRRLERYLSIAWDSRAIPVVVLTKSDLCENLEDKLSGVSSVAIGVDVLVTTSTSKEGYIPIKKYIRGGSTIAFIGSSGVGKSTLINMLLGFEKLDTKEIRKDDKGRHTTTSRRLIILPEGGVVIDTPGMREIGIESANLSKSFKDIDEIATACKFRDCTHETEPGCAVRKAIDEGWLQEERLNSYKKLKKEAKYEGMGFKQIEKEKINDMFGKMGGIKNVKKIIKEKKKRGSI